MNQSLYRFSISCLVLVATWGAAGPATAQPNAADIQRACAAALKQPMQYQMSMGGRTRTVYRKPAAPGQWATAVVDKVPIKTAAISDGVSQFIIFPDQKLAIDALPSGMGLDGLMMSAIMSMIDGTIPTTATAKVVEKDGKTYNGLELKLTPEGMEKFADQIKFIPKAALPDRLLLTVDRETHLPIEIGLASATTPPQLQTCSGYKIYPTLADTLFVVPKGYTVKTPKNAQEFLAVVAELMPKAIQSAAAAAPGPSTTTSAGDISKVGGGESKLDVNVVLAKAAMARTVPTKSKVGPTTVYHKTLDDGTPAERIEGHAPGQVRLDLHGEVYELYPRKKLAIDMSAIAEKEDSLPTFHAAINGRGVKPPTLLGEAKHGGKRCYEVEFKTLWSELG